MPTTVNDIVAALFARAPREIAEPWDNVGLIVGDPQARVRRAVVCVDATEPIVAEAVRRRAQLIIAHHPLFVEPLKRVRADGKDSAVAYRAARAGLAVCSMHTNLDYAPQGLCVELARVVGLSDIRPLSAAGASSCVKLAVFVPPTHLDPVRAAVANAGGGVIGNYAECSFGVEGEGTYRPMPGAVPHAGTVGKLERAREVRLEMIVPRSAVGRAVRAMEAAHPYEEVAYDLYPLANEWPNSARGALGSTGRAMTVGGFARRAAKGLRVSGLRTSGDAARKVRMVAVGSGSGGHLVDEAVAAGADVLFLGEIRHSDALRARARGLSVIEAGHYATELRAVDLMRRWLREDLGRRVEVMPSRVETDPLRAWQAPRSLSAK
jgi:dinuclear metal center YbgI/SA1388 family protein